MGLPSPSSRQCLLAMAGLCIAGVVAALVAQYGFDMQPCPYCILQRVFFVVIALLCIVGALAQGMVRKVLAVLAGVFALFDAAAAIYQHFVASKSASCNLTFADKVINALHIEDISPTVFAVRGNCADAAVSVLGVSFDLWSLALAVLLLVMAIRPIIRG
ncbi:MAG: disulfide bond formation protein B [Burkholderiales bacterium]|nr:disulfide bond formation protein B [Burkholderiales bacterium]